MNHYFFKIIDEQMYNLLYLIKVITMQSKLDILLEQIQLEEYKKYFESGNLERILCDKKKENYITKRIITLSYCKPFFIKIT